MTAHPALVAFAEQLEPYGVQVIFPLIAAAADRERARAYLLTRGTERLVAWVDLAEAEYDERLEQLAELVVRTFADLEQYGPELDRWTATGDGLGHYVWVTRPTAA